MELPLTFKQAEILSSVLANGVKTYRHIMDNGGIQDLFAIVAFVGMTVDPEKIDEHEATEQVMELVDEMENIQALIKEYYGI